MAASTTPLTLAQFHAIYAGSERLEFWHGSVIEKAMPTWLHSLLQSIITEVLARAGYISLVELRLKMSSHFEPVPDIAAGRKHVSSPYPTRPDQVEIVVEVLSPEDRFLDVHEKCRFYADIGIAQIYVVDPVNRVAYMWNAEHRRLNSADEWRLTNGSVIVIADLWREMHTRGRFDQAE